jgi:hypothetical protein
MPFAVPELMAQAATDLATIGSTVNAAHMAAAPRTLPVRPAAADEVSTGIAQLFSQHAANYQAMAAQAAAFNDQFVQHLTAGAFSYASIEAAIASFLQDLNVNADQILNSFIRGIVGVSALAVFGSLFVAVLLVTYVLAALPDFLMTGQILSLRAFLSSIFSGLLA